MYIFFGPGCLNFEFDSIFLGAKHPQEVKCVYAMMYYKNGNLLFRVCGHL